uniref:N-acylneuraminate cytidylyltransferase n=1 Tax=Timema monikensis TaxID=170555 RepID=A0A7R9HL55_9NEOP|nr:unnamed protein product [Timema monikensis]
MIPRKNLAKIGNQTLLEMSLQVMNNFGKFASVWVSTDDDEIATVAQRLGASVHRRSAETATDTAPSIVGVQEFCVNHPEVVVVALIQCTSPFLRPSFLDTAYSMMLGGDYDSVFSVTREFKLRWKELSELTYRLTYDTTPGIPAVNYTTASLCPTGRRATNWTVKLGVKGTLEKGNVTGNCSRIPAHSGCVQSVSGSPCRESVRRHLFPGGVEPLNFDPSHRPRRQDWPGELVENGMFYFTTCRLAQQGLLQGERCGIVEIPKNCSIEIDTPLDLELARMQLDSHLFS